MASLIIEQIDDSKLNKLITFLKDMHVESRVLTSDEEEDLNLGHIIEQTDRTTLVSREEVMKRLGRA